MINVWIDYQPYGDEDEDYPPFELEVQAVPRIGEKVAVRQPDGMKGTSHFALDYVVDVRHYLLPTPEVRVLTSSRR